MAQVAGMIQARMGSSRLPGKSMLPLGGTTALGFLIERVRRSSSLDKVIVVTSDQPENDPLLLESKRAGAEVFRGSEHDVLDRLASAAAHFQVQTIVRVTGDDVLMDPEVIDFMVDCFQSSNIDCATGLTTRSFPNGFVVSVLSRKALETANAIETSPSAREHVIPAFLQHRDQFVVMDVHAPPAWTAYDIGLTLDTQADYELLSAIVALPQEMTATLDKLLTMLSSDDQLREKARRNGDYWESQPGSAMHCVSR